MQYNIIPVGWWDGPRHGLLTRSLYRNEAVNCEEDGIAADDGLAILLGLCDEEGEDEEDDG